MTDAEYYLNILSGPSGPAHESTEAEIDLSAARIANSIDALQEQIDSAGTDAVDAARANALMSDAANAMQKLSSEGSESELTLDELTGLEAVIRTDGSRPALFVQNNTIPVNHASLGEWHDDAQRVRTQIGIVTRSVGRIDDPAAPQKFSGTGFVIDPGVIVTNRHVLEAIADEGPGGWTLNDNVTINFGHEFEGSPRRGYAITDVLFAGPNAINGQVNFDNLDMAILKCDTDADFPPKIKLAAGSSTIDADDRLYVVGYPARPRREDSDVLTDIFSNTFGYKRWSPGKVKHEAGKLTGDDEAWVVSHDASTLGGNSGSAVFSFSGNGDVCIALHFAGLKRKQNYAHVIAKLESELAIR